MVFGLARMRLTLEEAGEPLCLETFDLACACDRNDYETIVLEILDELIDTEDRRVSTGCSLRLNSTGKNPR